jgi:hypothetical protein
MSVLFLYSSYIDEPSNRLMFYSTRQFPITIYYLHDMNQQKFIELNLQTNNSDFLR